MKYTPEQVYDKLINEDKILETKGQIKFYLGDVDIVVRQRDVVGNIIQEWLLGWLEKNEIEYELNPNTQMPPDFYLNKEDLTKDLLEVKAFNYEATPAFDIADFNMYQSEIIDKPYMLYVKYLIFGYTMSSDGYVIINNIWIKNVWEICRRMREWALNLQIKNNVVHKIRPCTWYSKSSSFPPFKCLEDFISAIEQTVYQYPKTRELSGSWLAKFNESYFNMYHKKLKIQRWQDIEDDYVLDN